MKNTYEHTHIHNVCEIIFFNITKMMNQYQHYNDERIETIRDFINENKFDELRKYIKNNDFSDIDTYELNRIFKINGRRFVKRKGVLTFITDATVHVNDEKLQTTSEQSNEWKIKNNNKFNTVEATSLTDLINIINTLVKDIQCMKDVINTQSEIINHHSQLINQQSKQFE